jgi:hypothetical protein
MSTESTTNPPIFDKSTLLDAALLGARLHEEPEREKRHYDKTNQDNLARLRAQGWKKGQSGNPKGRPIKNLSLVSLVKERLEQHPEDAKAIALALISLGKSKDMRAIEELLNRIDGKVVETHKIEGTLPIRLIFVPAQQLLEEQKTKVIDVQPTEIKEIV